MTARTFRPPEGFPAFYQFLMENGFVKEVSCGDESLLRYTPREIVNLMEAGDDEWRQYVPAG